MLHAYRAPKLQREPQPWRRGVLPGPVFRILQAREAAVFVADERRNCLTAQGVYTRAVLCIDDDP
jgi:hypothetical protein